MESQSSTENSTVAEKQNGNHGTIEKTIEIALQSHKLVDQLTVVKRNGMLVPFRRDRILNAIEAAWRAHKAIPITTPLSQEDYSAVQGVCAAVVEEVQIQALKGACLTVEGIQDIVEVKLMEAGHYEVARSYIIYRDEQKEIREDSPRNLKVLRRDGKKFVRFNPMKIASAIERAIRASRKIEGSSPAEVIDAVNVLTNKVVARAKELNHQGVTLGVELLQDEIEKQLMAEGLYQEAKDFILYRAERAAFRSTRVEED
ncbi:MAG: hypothetical protein KDD62_10605, partial [Bdellovibrionales bacterium]|nr:hypothetical protein [Bdellovibrionales bacterium]